MNILKHKAFPRFLLYLLHVDDKEEKPRGNIVQTFKEESLDACCKTPCGVCNWTGSGCVLSEEAHFRYFPVVSLSYSQPEQLMFLWARPLFIIEAQPQHG